MIRSIGVNDLKRHTANLQEDIIGEVAKIIESGWFVLGEAGLAFEKDFARYCGTAHCVGVANGTDALELALRALGVAAGARVATVANAGLYTVTALLAIGAHPVFVDIEPRTQLMDLRNLEQLVDARAVDAIVVTHLFGLMHDIAALRMIADSANLPLLEDCAQAHGARRGTYGVGTVGDAATFSFYPTKNLGGIGDGGAVVTSNPEVAARVRILRQYGWETRYCATMRGARNSRLDELQAAVLRLKLPHLDGWNTRRREIATSYSSGIRHSAVSCPPVRGSEYVAHLYVVTCEGRDELRRHLAEVGIASDVHYPTPDHLQPSMAGMADWPELAVTERLARSNLTLPCYPELSNDEVEFVIDRVNCW